MKRINLIFVFLLCYSVNSQSLSVFDVDTISFPVMKAKFYTFDAEGKQVKGLSPSDFKITENGIDRTVLSVSCPADKPAQRLSSVIVIDVSGSMTGNPLLIAKTTAKTWVNALPLGQSDCAVTSFDNGNYFNQDFTTNRNKLLSTIDAVSHGGGTDYNMAMIEPIAGGILVAKTAKHKKVIIFITDGQPNQNPDESRIIATANANNITIHCITINLPAHPSMKHFAEQTGGSWFENVTTEEQAKDIAKILLAKSLYDSPCEITWNGGVSCQAGITKVKLEQTTMKLTANFSYQSPNSSVSKLEFNPSTVKFLKAVKDTCITITITARNSNFNITNITPSNPSYRINPTTFTLKTGESKNLTICYTPADSGYTYCKFDFENDLCKTKYLASGGFPGKKPTIRTLKLIHPNGGQVFVAGKDTVINWEGVLPEENVKIEYSTNRGTNWLKISDSATGLSYKWRIPKTPSNQCLARVTAKAVSIQSDCPGGDVQICNQLWMGCNLDVDTYRNGDPIPEVQDAIAWFKLTTGAWCYYNNDPGMEAIYGKLYNWYAVNDPRGLAPAGWHIPTETEWKELEMCLGMTQAEADKSFEWRGTDEGGKLKEAGTSHWLSPNTGATNSSGFSALPGGFRYPSGNYSYIGVNCNWWSSTEDDTWTAWVRYLGSNYATILRNDTDKTCGCSVRCVRD